MKTDLLTQQAIQVLRKNDLGGWTRPTPGLYPHQWFWDSCFIAIGLRHTDIERAQQEIRSLLKGQWSNGMMPHIIFSASNEYYAGFKLWQSRRHPDAPQEIATTAITQPPMLAEAVVRIGELLPAKKRLAWYKETFPAIVRYHSWLYKERDPREEGLVLLVHSWESGLDNTPPWMKAIENQKPLDVALADQLHMGSWLEYRRKDRHHGVAGERLKASELRTLYRILTRLRNRNYQIERILDSDIPLVIDLPFNALLVRANSLLQDMAQELKETLPIPLQTSMHKAAGALHTLQSDSGEFFSRDFRTHEFIREPSVATFLALYSGAISPTAAGEVVKKLQDPKTYWLKHPVPSTSAQWYAFAPRRYWQGPTWVNTNWLIIDGLRRYGYDVLASELRDKTLRMVAEGGMYEYFSPLDGKGAGASPFSWTAALTLDLLQQK